MAIDTTHPNFSRPARSLKTRAERLGVSPAAQSAAAGRNACLLTTPIDKLVAVRDALACGLHLSDGEAAQLWLRSPHLLRRDPKVVLLRFAQLCEGLSLSSLNGGNGGAGHATTGSDRDAARRWWRWLGWNFWRRRCKPSAINGSAGSVRSFVKGLTIEMNVEVAPAP